MPSADTEASAAADAAVASPPDSTTPTSLHDDATKLSPGDPGHGRMRLALFAAGLATFALLYSTQALLPEISRDLHADPGSASWTVSGATIGLALAVLPLAALSERFGRRRVLTVSMSVAVALALAVPFSPDLGTLIALRTLQGAAIAGVPASAMAYLADEVRGRYLVGATGLFVAGNSVGGMSGRILSGWVAEAWGWRIGLAAVAVASLLCVAAFRLLAPRARHFRPSPLNARALTRTVSAHLRNPLLVRLYAIGLLFMVVFGGVYTVIGYRLVAEPFGLSQGLVGSVFAIYLVGTATSATAGKLNARLGRRGLIYAGIVTASSGLLLSLLDSFVAVAAGLVLITAGFFAGHAVASGSVSHTATEGRAQASALYQMAYYTGSSLGGALGAAAFAGAGWDGTVALTLGAMTVAAGVTFYGTRSAAALRRRRLLEARA
ncbi:MFS transporter [Streptomyces sp. WMMB 322]|uniref:MFS transporter n=1 Tax=Streptomyces sp. WMMB 322 TaxID=1286821 RepID=UPI0006E38DA1|nr:MFS transporter [Streptomyces sp. WMMB 322]SCK27370.1 MFS transporter, YNFM family, putative membrane transport protein [Streptomyces sp. WMMB 322]